MRTRAPGRSRARRRELRPSVLGTPSWHGAIGQANRSGVQLGSGRVIPFLRTAQSIEREGKHGAELIGAGSVEERAGAIEKDATGEDHASGGDGSVRVLESFLNLHK